MAEAGGEQTRATRVSGFFSLLGPVGIDFFAQREFLKGRLVFVTLV